MMNKAQFFLFCFLLTIFPSMARAQQCDIVAEEIITLREPVFKTPMIWGEVYGGDGMEQITALAPAHLSGEGETGYIIAGTYTHDEKDKVIKPFIARLDKRGKLVWETRHKGSTMKTIERLLVTKGGYAVLGDIKSTKGEIGFYIAQYSKTGKRLKNRNVFVPGSNLKAKGFTETKDKNGFIVAVEAIKKEKRVAVLYRVNKSGTIIWNRKYSPGLETVFDNLQRLSDGRLIASGQIEQEDNRMAGWLMQLDEDGAIGWQRQYPRGSFSKIDTVRLLSDQTMVMSGAVKPLKGKTKSGWIMKTDSTGTPIWQRYYSGHYNYETKGIMTEEDGRLSALLNAYPLPGGVPVAERRRGHARLLTLSPRGYLMNVESFSDGHNAQSTRFTKGPNQERIVSGSLQTNIPDNMEGADNAEFVLDGWIFSVPSLEPYQDPCL